MYLLEEPQKSDRIINGNGFYIDAFAIVDSGYIVCFPRINDARCDCGKKLVSGPRIHGMYCDKCKIFYTIEMKGEKLDKDHAKSIESYCKYAEGD